MDINNGISFNYFLANPHTVALKQRVRIRW